MFHMKKSIQRLYNTAVDRADRSLARNGGSTGGGFSGIIAPKSVWPLRIMEPFGGQLIDLLGAELPYSKEKLANIGVISDQYYMILVQD
jgi:hypothetical protein